MGRILGALLALLGAAMFAAPFLAGYAVWALLAPQGFWQVAVALLAAVAMGVVLFWLPFLAIMVFAVAAHTWGDW